MILCQFHLLVPSYRDDTSRLHHPYQYQRQYLRNTFNDQFNFWVIIKTKILPLQLILGSKEFGPSEVFQPVWHWVVTLASTCVLCVQPSIPCPHPRAYPLGVLRSFLSINQSVICSIRKKTILSNTPTFCVYHWWPKWCCCSVVITPTRDVSKHCTPYCWLEISRQF